MPIIDGPRISSCACVFTLLHSSIACHKIRGINLKERKKRKYLSKLERGFVQRIEKIDKKTDP